MGETENAWAYNTSILVENLNKVNQFANDNSDWKILNVKIKLK